MSETARPKTTIETARIRLERRVRFEGDTDPPFWQADVWLNGIDYHAVGDTPYEALLELALFWGRREKPPHDPLP